MYAAEGLRIEEGAVETASTIRSSNESSLPALRRMRVPSMAGYRLHMGEAGARRRIGNADKMLARRTLNLPAGIARVALQRLIAVGTIEFKLVGVHRLPPIMRNLVGKIHKRFIHPFS